MKKDFAEKLFVGPKREPQFIEFPAHTTLENAILHTQGDRAGWVEIAEYKLVRVVQAKMIPDILCEVG